MPDIQYIGENLLPRQIGHFAIVLSFVASLLAAIAYFISTQKSNKDTENDADGNQNTEGVNSWRSIGRWSFGVHGISVLTIISMIFYVMINKRFEYFYAHSHVDNDLAFRYVFAAFWEGQEGSFLLWMFWHVGLGGLLILKAKTWESPVLSVLSMIQLFLSSMILGLHFGFGDYIIKWGSNPILLLREANDAPIFAQADYLSKIAGSAKGLNVLLQNYWMTIHPPTLFLGFASTSIPFCFAIAGLWTKKYTEWLRPAMPYALFSAAILGLGILMGGAWAYEALSFNGYWAWDPVENMSLVPWIVLVAGIHTHLITKATGHSLRATFAFYILTFLLTVYSTFLTRSGVLGETSVHAFSEIGLEWQLVLFQVFFIGLGGYFFIKNYKKIPSPETEEAITSKEFWMFIGSLILILSVVLITFTTSIPLYNKVFTFLGLLKTPLSPPVDVAAHYNKTQLWIGVFMGLLSGGAQFLRFKEHNFNKYKTLYFKHLGIAVLLSALFTGVSLRWIDATAWQYILLLFTGFFTAVSNLDYIISFMRKNIAASGSAFSHLGFGILIIGIMASGLNKRWISHNRFAMEGVINFTDEQLGKNILLMKGKPMFMNGYEVTYESDTAYGLQRDFVLNYKQKSKDLKTTIDSFSVRPHILYDKKTGKIATTNPQTEHFGTYDVFSYIASLPPEEQDPEEAQKTEEKLAYKPYSLNLNTPFSPKNDSSYTPQYSITVEGLDMKPKHPKYVAEEKDVAVGVKLVFSKGKDTVLRANPLVLLRDQNIYQLPSTINELGIRVKADVSLFERLFMPEKGMIYKDYVFKQGETLNVGKNKITLMAVNPNPQLKNFTLEQGDLAFTAELDINTEGVLNYRAAPAYVIRGAQPIPIRDDVQELGLHFVISKVEPQTGSIHIKIAEDNLKDLKVPIAIAEGAPRTDFIVLEATINPGINLVWLGCLLMLAGLSIAMVFRIRK
jgi:cytochrome c-type biogenesis protein CcmF